MVSVDRDGLTLNALKADDSNQAMTERIKEIPREHLKKIKDVLGKSRLKGAPEAFSYVCDIWNYATYNIEKGYNIKILEEKAIMSCIKLQQSYSKFDSLIRYTLAKAGLACDEEWKHVQSKSGPRNVADESDHRQQVVGKVKSLLMEHMSYLKQILTRYPDIDHTGSLGRYLDVLMTYHHSIFQEGEEEAIQAYIALLKDAFEGTYDGCDGSCHEAVFLSLKEIGVFYE